MIRLNDLPHDAALSAIDEGEFPAQITGGANVAVIMTQSWCADWIRMRVWLRELAAAGQPSGPDIDVYVLTYNKTGFRSQFLRHKEEVFGNALIPYVRYYRNGVCTGDSNQIGQEEFLSRFAV